MCMTDIAIIKPLERSITKREIEKLDRFADALDNQFRIPGTNIRFGFDTLAGLIPGVGDTISIGSAAYLIHKGWTHGARKRTLSRMVGNAGIDFFLGSVPVVGDIFDLFYKANRRNVDLLRKELEIIEAAKKQA